MSTVSNAWGDQNQEFWKDGSLEAAAAVGAVPGLDPAVLAVTKEARGWDDVEYVLRSKDFGPGGDGKPSLLGGSSMFAGTIIQIRRKEHDQRRRLESVLFRSDTLRGYELDRLEPGLDRVLADLAATAPRDENGYVHSDLKALTVPLMLDVMTALVGLDGLDTPETLAELTEKFDALDRGVRALVSNSATGDEAERMEKDARAIQKWLIEGFFTPSWERRRQLLADVAAGRLDRSELPNDLITAMLEHGEHFNSWERDPEVCGREATVFLIASIGSTMRTTSFALAEIEDWIAAHPDDAEKRTDPRWIFRCVRETLRIHGTPTVPRVALADCVLPSGLEIREDDLIWVNLRSAIADRYGDDHDKFNPSREPPPAAHRYGLAFSDGRHTCPGKGLILNETIDDVDQRKGAMATILLKLFEAGGRIDHDREFKLYQGSMMFKSVDSCPIVFTDL